MQGPKWPLFFSHIDPVWSLLIIGIGYTLGRAPRTKETLPDFREWCQVTRHSRVFRGLTGCQRTPRIWGVTNSLYDLLRLGGCLSTGHGLKSEYSAKATRGYQQLQVSPRFRVEGSGSRKLRVQEVFAELPQVVVHASRGMDYS